MERANALKTKAARCLLTAGYPYLPACADRAGRLRFPRSYRSAEPALSVGTLRGFLD